MACTRCGSNANQCACVVQGRRGVHVSGSGAPNDPYQLSFDGGELVGNGLLWNNDTGRLAVRLADQTLGFAPSGGLFVTGKQGDSGAGTLGATAEALETRAANQDVVGGLHGAGYMIKPQDTRGSVTYGVQRGHDLMHLPVRMLHDGTPVIASDATLDTVRLGGWGGQVQEQDMQRWRTIPTEPGLWTETEAVPPPADPAKDHRSEKGWFGFLEPNQMGLTSLADVFDLLGRSCVLLLELRFPTITTAGWADPAPPDSRVRGFLERTSTLIRRYGLTQSVVVTTATPKVPQTDTAELVDVLEPFKNANVRVGPVLTTPQQAEQYPPGNTWPAGWSWAVLGAGLPMDTLQSYTSATGPIHCLLTPVSRQYQHPDLVAPSGAMGVLSPDPEYFAGAIDSHPTAGNYTYRRLVDTWLYGTVQHGLLPANEGLDMAQANQRLQIRRVWNGGVPVGGDVFISHETEIGPHFLLMGQNSPIPDATTYYMDLLMDVRSIGPIQDGPTRAELAFAITKDVALTTVENTPDQSGYVLQYEVKKGAGNGGVDKFMRVWTWDPDANNGQGASTPLIEMNLSAYGYDWKRVMMIVNPNGLTLRFLNRDTGAIVQQESSTTQLAKTHRGRYLYLGRNSTEGSGATVPAFTHFTYKPGEPPAG